MKDRIFRTDEYICDLRTVGVLVRDGKLLVQRDRDGSEYALPGGHVKIGESTADGLVREYKEETLCSDFQTRCTVQYHRMDRKVLDRYTGCHYRPCSKLYL